ncbi:hypothetical protein N7494_001761 [Penicillium frequentans]|uniref:Uncharacterized protein n=1 Tax=Penicillium frequentans TaxID=3151616 RepID=A0AAD6D4E4_9EURO|nr:hypothetical protein N7494_001761 [Penicillium glabrum]
MPDYDLHKQYAKCMIKRSEGHALYRNVSAEKLKPGTCGYFDNDGDWQVILQTTNAEELQKHGLSPLGEVRTFTDDGEEYWSGPITSEGVKGERVNLEIQAADGTTAVIVGGKLEFSSSQHSSAILIADGVVEHNQAAPATNLRKWGSAQAQALIDISGDHEIIKEKGFWIVTKTYCAKRCSISLLSSKESKSSYSVNAQAYGVRLRPTVEWWNSQKDDDWRDLSNPNGLVMFMCGIWWRPRFLSKKLRAVLHKRNQESLAGHTGPLPIEVAIQSSSSVDPDYYQLTPAAVGKDRDNSLNLPQAKGSPYGDGDATDSDLDEADDFESDVDDD